MSLLGLFRKSKKEDHPSVTVSDTHVNSVFGGSTLTVPEETNSDGFVVLPSHHQQQYQNNDPLPYDVRNVNPPPSDSSAAQHSNWLIEQIPFQFAPQYSTIWNENNKDTKQTTVNLKEIDWDSLNYDFKLERSILHG